LRHRALKGRQPVAKAQRTAERERLHTVIGEVAEAEQQAASVEAAQTRAREQTWALSSRVAEAQAALHEAEHGRSARIAAAYVNDDRAPVDLVAEARAALDKATADQEQITEVVAALAAEALHIERVLAQLRTDRAAALAAVVVASPEFAALLARHSAAWRELRSVKVALRCVVSAAKGQIDDRWISEPLRSEPTEIRVDFGVNDFVADWVEALAQLEQNADAELPSN
jgi:hypothetical protein